MKPDTKTTEKQPNVKENSQLLLQFPEALDIKEVQVTSSGPGRLQTNCNNT